MLIKYCGYHIRTEEKKIGKLYQTHELTYCNEEKNGHYNEYTRIYPR